MSDLIGQSLFIDGADLLQQDDRITIETVRFRVNLNMRWQLGLLNLSGDRSDDDRWAKSVADIVLNHEDRPDPALFGSYDRRKIRKKNIASLNYQ